MITTLATVKTIAGLFDLSGDGVPTGATTASLGDIYMDTLTGLSYECTSTDPTIVWTAYTKDDAILSLTIQRAENDFLVIRGIPFKIDPDTEETLYPTGSDFIAAEMACYIAGVGDYEGRGKLSESVAGRNVSLEGKINGYPKAIVSSVKRFHTLQ